MKLQFLLQRTITVESIYMCPYKDKKLFKDDSAKFIDLLRSFEKRSLTNLLKEL